MMKTRYLILSMLIVMASCSVNHSDEWTELFNGKDFTGWFANENPESFRVDNGLLLCSGERGHIFYEAKKPFKNFELVAEVMTAENSNSGILFHTAFQDSGWLGQGYEVQVNNSYRGTGNARETRKTGSLCDVRNVYYNVVGDNEWFKIRIRVVENHIEIFVNDAQVVDYIQPDKPYRGDVGSLLGEGTIALQAHDKNSKVWYRSVKIKRLPDGEKSDMKVDMDWDTKVTKLMETGFPLVDYHVHLKGGLTLSQAVENSLTLGINYGIAPNCGIDHKIKTDADINAYIDTLQGKPFFNAMQAEGREWVTLFSPEAVAKFDYVFADGMTYTDNKGRRIKVYKAGEVWVDDVDEFMDLYVKKNVAIIEKEPVDIYVNPTVIPEVIRDRQNELWTEKRMKALVDALAEHHVALEINARYKVPSAKMIKMAKEAGVKFTFGTNNNTADLGRLEYCFQMIDECGLTADDMWVPEPQDQKPVLVKGMPSKITG